MKSQFVDKEKQQSGKCRLIIKQVLPGVDYINLLDIVVGRIWGEEA